MADIEDFVLQRQDGRTLTEGMGLSDIERLGWPVSPVIAARWRHAGQPVNYDMTPGSLAQIVAGRQYVAIITEQTASTPSRLLIIDADAAIRREISTRQPINGKIEDVVFGWFERPLVADGATFGVVVSLPRGVTYQLDINAVSGNVVGAKESR